jgi:hypothetical protein
MQTEEQAEPYKKMKMPVRKARQTMLSEYIKLPVKNC